MSKCAIEQTRAELSARLRARRAEIEQAIATRVNAIADPSEVDNPEYAQSLGDAIPAAVDYGFAAVEHGTEQQLLPIPATLLAHTRVAARSAVSLDTILRHCFAAYVLLGDFLAEEFESSDLIGNATLQSLLRIHAALFEHLIDTITSEYTREPCRHLGSKEKRRCALVKRLLTGALIDASELAYTLDKHHIGVIARGAGAKAAIRSIAKRHSFAILMVSLEEEIVWAWLGSRDRPNLSQVEQGVSLHWPPQLPLATGEIGYGMTGWRRTHQQANAAFSIALRKPGSLTRYMDVALVASILQDDLLTNSLRELYLAPLAHARRDGAVLYTTLRAYFASGQNGASAAATLGVSRQTISNRLQTIEARIGRPLTTCATEVEAALRLNDF